MNPFSGLEVYGIGDSGPGYYSPDGTLQFLAGDKTAACQSTVGFNGGNAGGAGVNLKPFLPVLAVGFVVWLIWDLL